MKTEQKSIIDDYLDSPVSSCETKVLSSSKLIQSETFTSKSVVNLLSLISIYLLFFFK